MKTRKNDYGEVKTIVKRKYTKKVKVKEEVLQNSEIELPKFIRSHPEVLKNHPGSKPITSSTYPPTSDSLYPPLIINKLHFIFRFSLLSIHSPPQSYFHNRQTKPLPIPLSQVPFSAPKGLIFTPNPRISQYSEATRLEIKRIYTLTPNTATAMSNTGNTPTGAPPGTRQPPPHTAPSTASIEDYRSNKFQLQLPGFVKGCVSELKPDGSNYVEWEFKMKRCIDRVTKVQNYLDKENMSITDPDGDGVVFSMIELAVPFEIQRRLSGSAKDALRTIRSLFFFPSRSGHMATWREVLEIKYDDVSEIGDYFRKIDQKISDLDRAGFEWTKDSITGVLYQIGLGNAFTNVNNTLNARLRSTPAIQVTAREVEETIRAEKQTHQTDNITPTFSQLDINDHADFNAFQTSPSMNRRGAGNTGVSYRSATSSRGRGVFAHTPPSQPRYLNTPTRTYQLTPRVGSQVTPKYVPPAPNVVSKFHPSLYKDSICFVCSNTGHWSDTCPTKYPPKHHQPQPSTSREPVPPRSFRLNLIDANGAAFTVDATGVEDDDGPLPDGIWASEGTLTEVWDNPDEGVSDTGATHTVTGKLTCLTDVRVLPRPIPIRVATKAPKAYVTHAGTMHVKGDDGRSIAVPDTFYSPLASSTLISIPQLIQSGGSWEAKDGKMKLVFPCGGTEVDHSCNACLGN
ncbi:uncharacterized protein MELLADRAFT_114067 [Melampsora larici-populina 98AG31]|uniref:CCHC-type domain-containing protein n=1 Tax=Melampsora larici-populina (strain 98AG31 / pathotype 3-4-7) TaxID=747676 RepID=F4SC22_MELLP|nr:uncharacterized protein MELLADRAFT_114067 [Melampsora larici-populina 98AG31]EGF97811.1 hypothetical protein MELLADRAFT_114067 [Melampsora larici-populina 98AG31]